MLFWGVVLHFHKKKCHRVADGEMFPIRMQKLHNISVRQTYRWKARFVGFLAIYSFSRSTLGFMRNYQKSNDCSTKTCDTQQGAGVTCIFVNERHGALAHRAPPGLRFGYACWPQPAATRPCSQITLGRLVYYYLSLASQYQ